MKKPNGERENYAMPGVTVKEGEAMRGRSGKVCVLFIELYYIYVEELQNNYAYLQTYEMPANNIITIQTYNY